MSHIFIENTSICVQHVKCVLTEREHEASRSLCVFPPVRGGREEIPGYGQEVRECAILVSFIILCPEF